MRILIAGWQGQIARAFVEAAPACADIAACAIGRPALDICEPRSIERALSDIEPDIVINAAAYTEVDRAEIEAERAFALNRDGARLLAQAAERRGAAIIHISTDYVFDGLKASPYVETDSPSPATVYGKSKLAGEVEVQAANPRHVILRTAWLFSPFGRNFVTTLFQRARAGDELRIVDDQWGNPTYAPHLVEAILAIARRLTGGSKEDGLWGVYHLAALGTASWREMAEEVFLRSAQLSGPSPAVQAIRTADFPTRAPRLINSKLDCSKAEQAFDVRLPAWQEGVAACVSRLLA